MSKTRLKNIMRERLFQFKQFSVHHGKCPMPITTDSVLVGACAYASEASQVLDVGTGCGVIALMIAQRNPFAIIHAVDIHAETVVQAQQNFSESPWADRLTAFCADFLVYASQTKQRYDLIVSNPPYFTEDTLSPDAQRANARNTASLPLHDLIDGCQRLLTPGGTLCLITPYSIGKSIAQMVLYAGMYVSQCLIVKGTPTAQPSRIVWHITRQQKPIQIKHLVIELTRGVYTQEYIRLTREFYLKM